MKQGEKEEVVILRNGRPVALLVPFDEQDMEWFARERDPAFLESLAESRKQIKQGKTVSHSHLKAKLDT